MINWSERAAELAKHLAAIGAATDPAWIDAVRTVPRHELVPTFFRQADDLSGWERLSTDDLATRHRWAAEVYSDRTLVTALREQTDEFGAFPVPISSSTLPSLMLRMLELLAVSDAERVVEIGTGCGYNAALLCDRLGDHRVTSVDVDAELLAQARRRLAALGWRPDLLVADAGAWGPPAGYDRLIATCAVHHVPTRWLRGASPGAILIIPLTGTLADGALVRLVADGDGSAAGRFAPVYAGFMPLRATECTPAPAVPFDAAPTRPTIVDPGLLESASPFAFFAEELLPVLRPRRTSRTPNGDPVTVLACEDGRWARAWRTATGENNVQSGGSPDLWSEVEHAYQRWLMHDRPGWERFGLTVTPHGQRVRLDTPAAPLDLSPAPARHI